VKARSGDQLAKTQGAYHKAIDQLCFKSYIYIYIYIGCFGRFRGEKI